MQLDAKGRSIFDRKATGAEFASALEACCDWVGGVPDSVFRQVIPRLSDWNFAPRENHAVSLAFGACLAALRPTVLMQNSGIGLSADALLGTFRLYRQGLLLVVSNRGILPWEEMQHEDWGRVTPPVLDALDIEHVSFDHEGLPGLRRAAELAHSNRRIVALLVDRGNIDE
jgi:sulfopyruvate decarboxylase subunit alpha